MKKIYLVIGLEVIVAAGICYLVAMQLGKRHFNVDLFRACNTRLYMRTLRESKPVIRLGEELNPEQRKAIELTDEGANAHEPTGPYDSLRVIYISHVGQRFLFDDIARMVSMMESFGLDAGQLHVLIEGSERDPGARKTRDLLTRVLHVSVNTELKGVFIEPEGRPYRWVGFVTKNGRLQRGGAFITTCEIGSVLRAYIPIGGTY